MALSSDSAEYMRCTLREIHEAENANFIQVKNLPHLHVAVSRVLLRDSVNEFGKL